VHVQVDLAADGEVGVGAVAVGEAVQGERDGAVGGVLKGDDAVVGVAGLDDLEDVCGGESARKLLVVNAR